MQNVKIIHKIIKRLFLRVRKIKWKTTRSSVERESRLAVFPEPLCDQVRSLCSLTKSDLLTSLTIACLLWLGSHCLSNDPSSNLSNSLPPRAIPHCPFVSISSSSASGQAWTSWCVRVFTGVIVLQIITQIYVKKLAHKAKPRS